MMYGAAYHCFAVEWVDGRRADFYQDFVVPGNRLVQVVDFDNVWRTISGVSGFHALACSFHL